MYKLILTLSLWILTIFSINAQFQLDVEGDTKIIGNLDLRQTENQSLSIHIGKDAGKNADLEDAFFDPLTNILIGPEAGYNSAGEKNILIGEEAGYENTGFENIILGQKAGYANKSFHNVFIGHNSAQNLIDGGNNTFVGAETGLNTSIAGENTFIGYRSGRLNKSGTFNTFVGTNSGLVSGQDSLNNSIAIGNNAKVGCHNCAVIGGTGTNSVKVGIGTTTPQTDLHIKQSSSSGSVAGIRLEYDNDTFWRTVVDDSDDYNFWHNGSLRAYIFDGSGSFAITSDGRLKKNIAPLTEVLDKVMKLKPSNYYYSNARNAERKSWGFIAQEVEAIFPEIVIEKNGYKTLVYDDFAILSIKAIQELTKVVKGQEKDNEVLQGAVDKQQKQIEELTNLVNQLLTKSDDKESESSYLLELSKPATITQNQPNPFHKETLVNYFIPSNSQSAHIQITAIDGKVLGKVNIREKGKGQVIIKANSYPEGIYHYTLIVDGQMVATKRMMLTK